MGQIQDLLEAFIVLTTMQVAEVIVLQEEDKVLTEEIKEEIMELVEIKEEIMELVEIKEDMVELV